MTARTAGSTTVGIVGGGPAGLMLSHLLHLEGIESVVIDTRSRLEIEQTVRAGILERDSVRLLVDSGVSDRVLHEGHEHGGIETLNRVWEAPEAIPTLAELDDPEAWVARIRGERAAA